MVASARRGSCLSLGVLALPLTACTTIDPGPDFSIAPETFDADYYYCHVEPQLIFQQNCGPGLPSDNGSCHYSAAVDGMNLQTHAPIDCGGGDHPVLDAQGQGSIGPDSPAQSNLTAVSFEMNRDYTMAPLWLRPTGQLPHPRMIFSQNDVAIQQLLSTWASK